jgi:regulator of protease activity HflC (stomatin/prohibitin superfamily)
MNAIDPAKSLAQAQLADSPPGTGPVAYRDAVKTSEFRISERSALMIRWLTVLYAAGVATLVISRCLAALFPSNPVLAASRHGGLIAVTLASLLLALSGLIGTWIMAWARRRAAFAPSQMPVTRHSRWPSWARIGLPVKGDPALIGRMARWPQAIFIASLAVTAAACAWMLPMASGMPPAPAMSLTLGGAAIVLGFPLLIAERLLAATPVSHLPEAPSLRALLLLPVLAWPGAGLASVAAGIGVPFAGRIDALLAVVLIAVALELCLRAAARCFLPPPAPGAARAAIDSLLARMIADGVRARGISAPVRRHLGIDFGRGWALGFLRAAIPPVALLLLLLCWGLSGIVLVGLDQRAVHEQFGAPLAVLHPGVHAILPWPMGQVRRVEYGVVHETALAGPSTTGPIMTRPNPALAARPIGAEDLPPPDTDRLWEQAHPGELDFLIASESGGRQSFQVVSADIKVRYRIGLTDRDALLAAYRVAQPAALLRAVASRAMAGFFAGRTLDAVLGENREATAERLQVALQRDLDEFDPGIELVAVVIEAIHPPAGAAEAYHAVQAAEILAVTSISAERGRALATQAKAGQYSFDIVAEARASSAEATGTATADLTRFTADHAAALANGEAFLLGRRLASLAASLSGKTLMIVDHRIPETDAPVFDLRPQSPATARSAGPDQEQSACCIRTRMTMMTVTCPDMFTVLMVTAPGRAAGSALPSICCSPVCW